MSRLISVANTEVVFAGIEILGESLADLITISVVQRDEYKNSPPFLTRERAIPFLNALMTTNRSHLIVRRAVCYLL
jgi:hypothetical protein